MKTNKCCSSNKECCKVNVQIGELPQYSYWIGFLKTLKNGAVMFLPPVVLYIADNYVNFVPTEYLPTAAIIVGMISYFIKNYIENK
jgi:hypothetical protein